MAAAREEGRREKGGIVEPAGQRPPRDLARLVRRYRGVAPAEPSLFTYAVTFEDRRRFGGSTRSGRSRPRERLKLWATRPIRAGSSWQDKPLGAAWTDLALLRDGDHNGLRRLLHGWGLWGFADVVHEWARERWGDIYPASGRPKVWMVQQDGIHAFPPGACDAAARALCPILFQVAAVYRVAGAVLLESESWPTGENDEKSSFGLLLKTSAQHPKGRLAVLSALLALPPAGLTRVLRVQRDSARETMWALEILRRPASPIEEELLVLPAAWAHRPEGQRGTPAQLSSAAKRRKAILADSPHALVYFSDSFLALCWREFTYAVEHNILYRRCNDCGRFFAVPRGHYDYCDTCQGKRRQRTPRERLISRAMANGRSRAQAERIVRTYHRLEQQKLRTGRVGNLALYRRLRQDLGIRDHRRASA